MTPIHIEVSLLFARKTEQSPCWQTSPEVHYKSVSISVAWQKNYFICNFLKIHLKVNETVF